VGRNKGTEAANGDLLLFLDADVILPKNFFTKALKEFQERNLDVVTFCLEPQTEKKTKKILFELFYNLPILIFEKILSHASQAILVKKALHKHIGGFDQQIKFAEDHSYVRKAKKFGRYGILKSTRVLSSLRRFEKEGWLPLYLKYILADFYTVFFGDIKKDIFKYEFGHFKNKK